MRKKKDKNLLARESIVNALTELMNEKLIRNGRPEMSRITGTGCQLSGIATAFVVANPNNKTEAVAAAVCVMGLAGEIGVSRMTSAEGNSTLRNRIIDAIYNMDAETLNKGAKYEVR